MLSAIREIGKWRIKEGNKSSFDVLIQEPFKERKDKETDNVLFIQINFENNSFVGIDLEDYDKNKKEKYLYRKGSPNGFNPTPAAVITDLDKTFPNKIENWFKKYSESNYLNIEGKNILKQVFDIIYNNKTQITTELKDKISNLKKKTGKLLTLKLKFKDDYLYLGDIELFRKILLEDCKPKIDNGCQENRCCSVCGEFKISFTDKPGVFKFYTIDKPGFITGGFNEKNEIKNFPVCTDCKEQIEEGKNFIEKSLSYRFYGHKYYLIPKLLTGKIENSETMSILLDTSRIVSLKDEVKNKITNDEKEILYELKNEKDSISFNLFFLEKDMGAEKIVLLVEDVLPSRFRTIFEAKNFVEEKFDDSFTFGKIREFFSKSDENKRENDLDKYFLEIVDKIFRGVSIEFSFLVKFFIKKIRKKFIDDEYFNSMVKNAMMDTLFLEKLKIINFEEDKSMNQTIFEDIFQKYSKSLNYPAKKGIFLLGTLAQLLLNKQWEVRKAKPFMKKLKGLKMEERDIKALLPEIQNKFEEYDNSFDKGKQLIAREVSKLLLEAGDNWKMSVDEINYYFSCGMNLSQEIADNVYAKE